MRKWAFVVGTFAVVSALTTSVSASDFFENLKKDLGKVTGTVKEAIDDITEGKEDVEEVGDDAGTLKEEVTGVEGDEPRYDPSWVTEMQQRLTALGLDPGPVDGSFGKKTANAIVIFQKIADLTPDGKPRPSVLQALRERTPNVSIAQQTAPTAEQEEENPTGSAGSAPALRTVVSFGAGGIRDVSPVMSGDRLLAGYPLTYGKFNSEDITYAMRDSVSTKSAFDLALYIDLAVLGKWPQIIDDRQEVIEGQKTANDHHTAYKYANRFLTGALLSKYIAPCGTYGCRAGPAYEGWVGTNEFEREASYRAFVEQIGQVLIQKAPDHPLKFVHVREVSLEPYDDDAGGFPMREVRPGASIHSTLNAAARGFKIFGGGDLPSHVKMSRDQAPSFIVPFQNQKRRAYIAFDVSLGEPRLSDRLHTPEMTARWSNPRLYSDPYLQDLRHEFGGTSAETAIAPLGDRPENRNGNTTEVSNAQFMLQKLNYYAGAVDGAYSSQTQFAILSFEQDYGIPPSGNVTDDLLEHLSRQLQYPETAQGSAPTPQHGQSVSQTAVGAASHQEAEHAAPLTNFQMGLLAIRDLPEAISQEQLHRITKNQIEWEQRRWTGIDESLRHHETKLAQGESTVLNPKRPAFIYAWPDLENGPNSLSDPVLEILLGSRPDWSFVYEEPEWDRKYRAIVEAFVFTREQIHGRNPEFAARQLAPVVMRLLKAAASRTPSEFQVTVSLPAVAYDFETQALRVKGNQSEFEEQIDLLPPARNPVLIEDRDWAGELPYGMVLPNRAQNAALYQTWQVVPKDEVPKVPGRTGLPAELAAEQIRQSFNVGPPMWSATKTLAFDRHLKLQAIPMPPEKAEALLNAHRAGKGLKVRITFEAERTERAVDVSGSNRRPASVLFANLTSAELLDRNGDVVAFLPAEAFRTVAEQVAASAQQQQEEQLRESAELEEKAAVLSRMDIVDIRLDTKFSKAQEMVRQHMSIGTVVEYGPPAFPQKAFRDFLGFHSDDGAEAIVLFKGSPDSEDLVAIARRLILPKGMSADVVIEKLKEKYGQTPDRESMTHLEWTASADQGLCRVTLSLERSGLRVLHGKSSGHPPYTPTVRPNQYKPGHPPPVHIWQACGPTVLARITGSKLDVLLYDLRKYASHFPAAKGTADAAEDTKQVDLDL